MLPRCVEERLSYVDERLSYVDERLSYVDERLSYVDERLHSLLNGQYSTPESVYPLDCVEIRLRNLIKRVIRPF